jgi:hypothetical protein
MCPFSKYLRMAALSCASAASILVSFSVWPEGRIEDFFILRISGRRAHARVVKLVKGMG